MKTDFWREEEYHDVTCLQIRGMWKKAVVTLAPEYLTGNYPGGISVWLPDILADDLRGFTYCPQESNLKSATTKPFQFLINLFLTL